MNDILDTVFTNGNPTLGLMAFNGNANPNPNPNPNFNGNYCGVNNCPDDLAISPVPLPSTGALLGLVVVAAVVCSRVMRGES